jgi:hypothetical protein
LCAERGGGEQPHWAHVSPPQQLTQRDERGDCGLWYCWRVRCAERAGVTQQVEIGVPLASQPGSGRMEFCVEVASTVSPLYQVQPTTLLPVCPLAPTSHGIQQGSITAS